MKINDLQNIKRNTSLIGKMVIGLFFDNWGVVNESKSEVAEYEDYYVLKFKNKNSNCCNVSFAISKETSPIEEISFYLNEDGQILYNEVIENDYERTTIFNFISDVLNNDIELIRTIVNKHVYISKYLYASDKKTYNAINKIVWPWQKRYEEITTYKHWFE